MSKAILENIIGDIKRERVIFEERHKKPIIGWFCTYTPIEIFYAAGLVPKRLMSKPATMNMALGCMQANLCPYVLNSLESALQGKDTVDGLVIVNSCDAMRRLYDVWRYYVKTGFVHIVDLPRNVNMENQNYFELEIEKLISALEKYYSVKITGDSLRDAIILCNETRHLLKILYNLRLQYNEINLAGSEILDLIRLSMRVPGSVFNSKLKILIDEITKKTVNQEPQFRHKKPRILVAGSFCDQAQIKVIEECGIDIVYDQLCTGMTSLDIEMAINNLPVKALAEGYLRKAPCSRMLDPGQKIRRICEIIDKYYIDGVIFLTLKFCDNNIFFYPLLKRELFRRKTPIILIENDGTSDNIGQIRTRVEAFSGVL